MGVSYTDCFQRSTWFVALASIIQRATFLSFRIYVRFPNGDLMLGECHIPINRTL